jgi:hypothetical protein
LRLRLRLANPTVQSAGPSDSYFWHAGHFRHFSQFSAPAEGSAYRLCHGWREAARRAEKSGVGNERPCFRLSMGKQLLHAGPKGRLRRRSDRFYRKPCGVRHRDIGPVNDKTVRLYGGHHLTSNRELLTPTRPDRDSVPTVVNDRNGRLVQCRTVLSFTDLHVSSFKPQAS